MIFGLVTITRASVRLSFSRELKLTHLQTTGAVILQNANLQSCRSSFIVDPL